MLEVKVLKFKASIIAISCIHIAILLADVFEEKSSGVVS